MPHTRNSLTHKFKIDGHSGYITVGKYPDGSPGELFITMGKEGGTLGGVMDAFGTAISIALQHGVPSNTYVEKFTGMSFEPRGWVEEGDPNIKTAKSIMDYIFRWLGQTFPNEEIGEVSTENPDTPQAEVKKNLPKGEKVDTFCTLCGSNKATYKLGNCNILCDMDFEGCGNQDKRGCGA